MSNSQPNSTQQRLITATVDLVARVGFNSATTREIAKLAGVNEGSIFRCFGCKRDLFDAAIASELRGLRLRADLVAQLVTADDPRAALIAIFGLISDTVISRPQLVRMLHFSALEFGDEFGQLMRKHLGGAIDGMAGLLRRWSEQGTIRPVDALATLLSFVASVIAVQSFYPLLARHEVPLQSAETAAATYADFWCAALITMPHGNIRPAGATGIPDSAGRD